MRNQRRVLIYPAQSLSIPLNSLPIQKVIDPNLAKLLWKFYDLLTRKYDVFLVIQGYEGTGKSRGLLLIIIEYWYTVILKKPIKFDCYGVEFKDFINAINTGGPRDIAALDEAGDLLDTVNFRDKINTLLYQTYTIIREKFLFTIVVLPSFFDLNPRFRRRRVRGVFDVIERVDRRCGKCHKYFVDETVCPFCKTQYYYTPGYIKWNYYGRQQLNIAIALTENSSIKELGIVQPSARGYSWQYDRVLLQSYAEKKTQKMASTMKTLTEATDSFFDKKEKTKQKFPIPKDCPRCSSRMTSVNDVYLCLKCGKTIREEFS